MQEFDIIVPIDFPPYVLVILDYFDDPFLNTDLLVLC